VGIPAVPGLAPEAAAGRRGLTAGATSRSARAAVGAALALTLLGAALRFGTLDVQSIWLDESATLILVRRTFGGMLSHLASSESTPPLYYVLVWLWSKVFGAGPVAIRAFSALAGTLTIPVLFACGRQISARAGLWAGTLTVVNPAMYYYSQEARCYALLILFSAGALLAWQRALGAPTTRRLAVWGLLSALALLTHYFAVFLFIPEAVLLARRHGWRPVAPAVGGVVLVGLALAPLAIRERSDGKASWIEAASLASRAAESAKGLLIGLYGPVEYLTAGVAGLLAAAAVWIVFARGSERERRAGAGLAAIAATALAIPLVLAVTHVLDIYDGRNVIATWVVLATLTAIGLGAGRAPRLGPALGVGLCAVSVAVIAGTNAVAGYQRDDWRAVARALPATSPGAVIVGDRLFSAPLSIYAGPLHPTGAAALTTDEVSVVALRTRRTGRAPTPAVVPHTPPPGFRLAALHNSEASAVATFVAPRPTTISAARLRALSGAGETEVARRG
jgi:hypothetical protein